MTTYYLAGKNGFVVSNVPMQYPNSKGGFLRIVRFSEDIRLAHQFKSFDEADKFGQRFMGKTYYDIMIPANEVLRTPE